MKELKAALWVEMLKVRRTKIFSISIYFFIFIGVMMGLLMFLSLHPEIANRSSTIRMKTSFLGGSDWTAFYDLLIQVILTIGVIGSGFITSWVFGREFSDRAIKDLLALPVRRSTIVASKLIVLLGWSIILSVVILAAACQLPLKPGQSRSELSLFSFSFNTPIGDLYPGNETLSAQIECIDSYLTL